MPKTRYRVFSCLPKMNFSSNYYHEKCSSVLLNLINIESNKKYITIILIFLEVKLIKIYDSIF